MSVDLDVMQRKPFVRPPSAVNIYEIKDSTETNPQPESDDDKVFGEFLSPAKIKHMSGCSNLFDVMELKLKVDTVETSIGNLGPMVPNIRRLNMNNSFITSIRDLGTSFHNLEMLWLSRCSLIELDGVSSFRSLRELFISYNDVNDLSALSMVDALQVLDLEGNNIDDITQVDFLSLCTKLSILTLRGNPIEIKPTPFTNEKDLKFYSYQETILSRLPGLNVLDDEKLLIETVDGQQIKRANPKALPKTEASVLNTDIKMIQESLKTLYTIDDEVLLTENLAARGTSDSFETSRPLSAQRRMQSSKQSRAQIFNDQTKNENILLETADCSELTYGQVMCGNAVSALRTRRLLKNQKLASRQSSRPANLAQREVVSSLDDYSPLTSTEMNTSENKYDILEELRQWRFNNQALFTDTDVISRQKVTIKSDRMSNAAPRKSFSPTPPSKPKPNRSTRMRRSLQSPCTSPFSPIDDRPHTVAECRTFSPLSVQYETICSKTVDESNKITSGSTTDENNVTVPRKRDNSTALETLGKPSVQLNPP